MRIVIHCRREFQHHVTWSNAFAKGLNAHGITARIIDGYTYTDCDLAVFWGHHSSKQAIMEKQFALGLNYLVAEGGYVGDRMKWISLGYNGLNGQADFCNENSPPDRWKKHPEKEKPWNPGEEYILLIGQVPTDCAVRGVNFVQWAEETRMELVNIPGLPVLFRPHPLMERPAKTVSYRENQRDLEKAFAGAACVVTFNSTTGVNAILAGKPVIALDTRSMAWPVAGHELVDVLDPPMPDRQQWLNDLAYSQWTLKEIERGLAWEHLKRGPKHAGRAA